MRIWLQNVILGALPFGSMLETFQDQVRVTDRVLPSIAVHGKSAGVDTCLGWISSEYGLGAMSNVLVLQGIKAVVTLNEEFEVFISTRQYQACSSPRKLLLAAPLMYSFALGIMRTLITHCWGCESKVR